VGLRSVPLLPPSSSTRSPRRPGGLHNVVFVVWVFQFLHDHVNLLKPKPGFEWATRPALYVALLHLIHKKIARPHTKSHDGQRWILAWI
jgi:hypothetical protein